MNFSMTTRMTVQPNFDPEQLVRDPDERPFQLFECEAGRRFSSGLSVTLDGAVCDASGCPKDGHTIRLVDTTNDRGRARRWFWFPGIRKVAF